eukprot:TRINITY_DN1316_c0_g1_i1.p1 TRINITY_DN1316_c0_g1~~TRINITY_DN1316_c0_g1_i1.p1  ORF type:complete len:724 (-),score=107.58 TRINITY_DN1316_c0_g1_i1:7771-9942(-)
MSLASPSSPTSSAKRPKLSCSPERSQTKQEQVLENDASPASFDHALAQAQAWRRRRMASISRAMSRWTPVLPQPVACADSSPPSHPRSCHEPTTVSKQSHTVPLTDPSGIQQSHTHNGPYVQNATSNAAPDRKESGTPPDEQKANPQDRKQSPSVSKEQVTLDRYQTAALEAAKKGDSFFLTGSAGVGKSFVLRQIISELRESGKKVAVTASTGCAAVAIRGCTVHSFLSLGLGLDPEEHLKRRARKDRRLRRRLSGLDVLVIDEVSMIDSFLFDKIELMCAYGMESSRTCDVPPRSATNNDENNVETLPVFGGLQVIVCGDFFQLPPVSCSEYRLQLVKEKFFAFEAKAWKRGINKAYCLHQVHRQNDKVFVGILNELRRGIVSNATKNVLHACCVRRDAIPVEVNENGAEIYYTKLYPYRNQVDRENITQLNAIPEPAVRYIADDWVSKTLGVLNQRTVQTMLDGVSALKSFTIKKSCRVLCIKNIDPDNGIVNGSGGIVTGFSLTGFARLEQLEKFKYMTENGLAEGKGILMQDGLFPEEQVELGKEKTDDIVLRLLKELPRDESGTVIMSAEKAQLIPVVKFDNGTWQSVPHVKWSVYGLRGEVVGTRTQIPLTLGWALSIHKAQGMTLQNVETDVGNSFDYGQVYVALSRATSLQGLRLVSFNPFKVMTHHKVTAFHETVEDKGFDVEVKRAEDEFAVSDSELLALTNSDEWWNHCGG